MLYLVFLRDVPDAAWDRWEWAGGGQMDTDTIQVGCGWLWFSSSDAIKSLYLVSFSVELQHFSSLTDLCERER